MEAPRPVDQGDVLSVETPESVAFRLELAGIGSRGLALLVDTAVILAIVTLEMLVVLLVTWLLAQFAGVYSLGWSLGIFSAIAAVTYWTYFIWGETAGSGRTYGKRRIGLRVVRDDGGRIGFLDAAIRNLVRLVDILPGLYGVGMLTMLMSSNGKRLGDMAAGTVVVRDREDLALYFEGEKGPPVVALATEYLDRRETLAPDAAYQAAAEILRAFGEDPGVWDEPTIAGRLAELSGWRRTAGSGEHPPA